MNMTNRLTAHRLYNRMQKFSETNPSFRDGDIDEMFLMLQETIDLSEEGLRQSGGKYAGIGKIVVCHEFNARRDHKGALAFTGTTHAKYAEADVPLHLAREILGGEYAGEVSNPVEELGKVTLEQGVTYSLDHPNASGLDVAQSYRVLDEDGDILHEASTDDEVSRDTRYVETVWMTGSEDDDDEDEELNGSPLTPQLRQVMPLANHQIMNADGKLNITDKEWQYILMLYGSDYEKSLEAYRSQQDLLLASQCFTSFVNAMRRQFPVSR